MVTDDEVRGQTLKLVETYQMLVTQQRFDEWIELWADDGECEFPYMPEGRDPVLVGKATIYEQMTSFPERVEIETVSDQVPNMVTHDQFDPYLRVLLEETGDLTGEDHAREKRINIDPKAPAHNDGCAGRPRRRLLNAVEMRPDLLIKASAFVRERHRAGGTLQ